MREFIEWLNRRFPVQLTVKAADYDKLWTDLRHLRGYVDTLASDIELISKRQSELEVQIKRLNAASGFMPSPQGPIRLQR